MDDIIKLIDMSLEDGRLSQDDYRIILNKAVAKGISEEEFNLILAKRSKTAGINFTLSKQPPTSKWPYILAIIAIAATFLDWIKFYSHTSGFGSSANVDTSINAWLGTYGASILVIYIAGCYFYFKGNRFYWLAGLLAVVDALYIFTAITKAKVSYSYDYEGFRGSTEAGYELLWGFWLFVVASSLYALSTLLLSEKGIIQNNFKQNFRSGVKILGLSAILNIVVNTFLLSSIDDSFVMALIFSFVITLFLLMITLFVYIFSPSIRIAGYLMLVIGFISYLFFHFLANDRAEFLKVFIFLMSYPVSYILFERILVSDKNISNSIGGIGMLLFVSTLNIGCSDQPKMKLQTDSSKSIEGTYSSESGGVESSLTIIGTSWIGTHTETISGNVISSGYGYVGGNKIYDDYGTELGYVSNGRANVNIGGMQITLQKY